MYLPANLKMRLVIPLLGSLVLGLGCGGDDGLKAPSQVGGSSGGASAGSGGGNPDAGAGSAGTGGSSGTGGAHEGAGAGGTNVGTGGTSSGTGGAHEGAGAGGHGGDSGPSCATLPTLGGGTAGAGGISGSAGAVGSGGTRAAFNPAGAKVLFSWPVDYTWGSADGTVAIGDLNNDGKDDLAVAIGTSTQSDGVSLLLNNGDGTFAVPVNFATDAGATPYRAALGDLNGDGRTDLAVVSLDLGGVNVLLRNADGTFATAVTYKAASQIFSVALGDLNGDGWTDLAAGYDDGGTLSGVAVFLNKGDGTFAPAVGYGAGQNPDWIAVGDLNGDGKADLVIANDASEVAGYHENLYVFLNNGDGTFGAPVSYAAGEWLTSVTLADLNGDHRPDVVVTDTFTIGVGVLLNNGDGSFGPRVTYEAGVGGDSSVAVGDLDGDGNADLAITTSLAYGLPGVIGGDIAVLLNDGHGVFGAPVYYPDEPVNGAVAIRDLNGDGKADLVVANYPYGCVQSVSVLLNASP
jgi:FG-GAP-like repeat/FG-GAP repeat